MCTASSSKCEVIPKGLKRAEITGAGAVLTHHGEDATGRALSVCGDPHQWISLPTVLRRSVLNWSIPSGNEMLLLLGSFS